MKNTNDRSQHRTSIGGQALIEGVLMRGPKDIAIAVRKSNKEIVLKKDKLNTLAMRHKVLGLPFIRGVVGLVESMIFGINAIMYSADFFEDLVGEPKESKFKKKLKDNKVPVLSFLYLSMVKFNKWFKDKFKDKTDKIEMGLTLLFSLSLTLLLFFFIPTFLTGFFGRFTENNIFLNLIEGFIRVTIFLIYIVLVSKIEDIGRVFEYHGAEHKSIHCYEHGEELTVENVRKHSILHPRCGTSFLFMVMIISILVLSFFGWPNPIMRVVTRLLMLPIIAGIAYEINRIIGRSNSILSKIISYPGLFLQKIATVKEPDDEQIEVAIVVLEAVLTGNREEDKW